MPIDILMPQLSPTMTEGRLAKWLKQPGDKISAGTVIAEVETDKATMEVEASDDGILHALIGEPGQDLPVGAPIAILRGKDETVAADYKPKGKAAAPAPAPEAALAATSAAPVVAAPAAAPAPAGVAMPASILPKINTGGATVSVAIPGKAAGAGERVKASPLARRLAAEKGVNLSTVPGTGPHGRVVAADVAHAKTSGVTQIVRYADSVEKLTPMRKAIAGKLTTSKQTVPHFYLSMSVNMDRLMDTRAQLNAMLEAQKIKVSVNDFIIKACALALADFPAANAAWNGDSVVKFGNVDIAVAVSIEGGLITPVVQNADQKPLPVISAEAKQLAADARAGKLKPEQYEGGSFSLSNLGMFGVGNFQAIINPPQAAILACGAATERAIAVEGDIAIAQMMDMTLSVDHRVIDGALGAELLGAIKSYLENPIVLVM